MIPDTLKSFEKDEPVIIRNPKAIRPWQHVLEPLSGYLILAEKLYRNQKEYSEAWNFGPRENDVQSVKVILDIISAKWPNSSWELDQNSHPHEANYLQLDISKANSKLGWNPQWELSYTLEKIIEWHRAWINNEDMQDRCLLEIEEYMNKINYEIN